MRNGFWLAASVAFFLTACGGDDSSPIAGPTPGPTIPVTPPTGTPSPQPEPEPAPTLTPAAGSITGDFVDSDGTSIRARQLAGTSGWLVDVAQPLEAIYMFGQSNAGPSGLAGDDALRNFNPFPQTVITNSQGPAVLAGRELSSVVTAFQPLNSASESTPLPNQLDLIAVEQIARDNGRAPTGLYGFTAYQTGQPIKVFLPGSVNYDTLLADVRRETALARLYGRRFQVRAVIWHHGEHQTTGYAADLEQIIDGLQEAIPQITGQTDVPEFMIRQVSSRNYAAGGTAVPQDQFDVAWRRRARNVTMLGPTYFGKLSDVVHFGSVARAQFADVAGVAMEEIRSGRRFTPLWPVNVVRDGRQIEITFDVPGNGLQFDHQDIPQTDHEGFVYKDSTNSAAIQSVTIVDSRTIRIFLDREPTGTGKQIHYAMGNNPNTAHFPLARGTLYSPTQTRSVYARFNIGVPQYVRHYAVRFKMGLR